MIFFAPGTLVDPLLAPTVLGCPLAAPSDHRYGVLGVSLGDSGTWNHKRWGVAGGLGALGIGFYAT